VTGFTSLQARFRRLSSGRRELIGRAGAAHHPRRALERRTLMGLAMMSRTALLFLPLAASAALAEERNGPAPALDLVKPVAGVFRGDRAPAPRTPAPITPETRRSAPLETDGAGSSTVPAPDGYMEDDSGTSAVDAWWTRYGDTLRRAE
jgi:hypothetical protein